MISIRKILIASLSLSVFFCSNILSALSSVRTLKTFSEQSQKHATARTVVSRRVNFVAQGSELVYVKDGSHR